MLKKENIKKHAEILVQWKAGNGDKVKTVWELIQCGKDNFSNDELFEMKLEKINAYPHKVIFQTDDCAEMHEWRKEHVVFKKGWYDELDSFEYRSLKQ